jgi:predicted metal-binding membrane protein
MQHRLVETRRVQVPPAAAVALIVVVAWLVLIAFSLTGNGAAVRHDRLLQGGPPLWLATALFLGGWQVMLVAMMVPASLHAFARLDLGRPAVLFAGGFVAVWTAFGLVIFFFDAGIHAIVNHWPWLASHSWLIAGSTLVVAGTYQLSDLKTRSLRACRQLKHIRHGGGSAAEGALHALKCVGSSGGLMLLAFALTAGSLVAMAAITLLMAWEVTPWGWNMVKVTGYVLIALGIVVMAGPIEAPLWWQL